MKEKGNTKIEQNISLPTATYTHQETVYFSNMCVRESNTVYTKLVLFKAKLTFEFHILNITYSVVSARLFFKKILSFNNIDLIPNSGEILTFVLGKK